MAGHFELTERQREVILALLRYDTTKEMAEAMGILEKSVRDRLKHLYELFDVHSRHRLLAILAEWGLLRIEPRADRSR